MNGNHNNFFKDTDLVFLSICAGCSFMSVLSLYAIYTHMNLITSVRTVVVQAIASIIGVALAVLISHFDYKEWCEQWKWHFIPSCGLMILTMFIGFAPPGTTNKAWIQLPFGLTLQSSEVLKISTILMLSYFLEKYKNNINEIKTLLKLIAIACVPLAFVAIQRDSGTLLVYCAMVACMFFAAGVSGKFIAICRGGLLALSPFIWSKMDPYKKNRILGLFDPDKYSTIMWQQNMGKISIGSGRILGKGFFTDNHNATPLAYNDFIFSFMAECVGFVGIVIVLGLIMFLWIRTLKIAGRSRDLRGTFICVGVFGMLMAQTIINIGMNLSVLPVIGVTLPLFTAGGTSVIVTYCAMGFVLSVARHNPKTLFN